MSEIGCGKLDQYLRPLEQMEIVSQDAVANILRKLHVPERDLLDQAEFSDDRPYGRRLIIRTRTIEVLLMGFREGSECPPHDHGGSIGLVYVCVGTAEHSIFQWKNGGLLRTEQRLSGAGGILDAPADCVHAMRNPGPGALVTLHVYWPPIQKMSIFDLQQRMRYAVNDKAGAWLPVVPETVLSSRSLD